MVKDRKIANFHLFYHDVGGLIISYALPKSCLVSLQIINRICCRFGFDQPIFNRHVVPFSWNARNPCASFSALRTQLKNEPRVKHREPRSSLISSCSRLRGACSSDLLRACYLLLV